MKIIRSNENYNSGLGQLDQGPGARNSRMTDSDVWLRDWICGELTADSNWHTNITRVCALTPDSNTHYSSVHMRLEVTEWILKVLIISTCGTWYHVPYVVLVQTSNSWHLAQRGTKNSSVFAFHFGSKLYGCTSRTTNKRYRFIRFINHSAFAVCSPHNRSSCAKPSNHRKQKQRTTQVKCVSLYQRCLSLRRRLKKVNLMLWRRACGTSLMI